MSPLGLNPSGVGKTFRLTVPSVIEHLVNVMYDIKEKTP